ncbi:hypothetical protein BHE74_00057335 [Ensete ventricosum]|nr:hypothetical protein BHE74_00057335 [Ensete ventricosum]
MLAWGASNGGYSCYDPRGAVTGLGRQRLALLRSRVGDAVGQVEAIRKQRWECRCYCVWLKAGAIVEESADTWAIDGRWGYQQ